MGTGSISVVVPTYRVAAYLPTFLASLETSMDGVDAALVEFVFVDDGSPDDSASIITDWIGHRPELTARLVRQDNGGLSAARNTGLEAAVGEWVTFPDPDDFLDAAYLGVMSRFVASPAADSVHIVTGRPILYDDPGSSPAGPDAAAGTYRDEHPMRHRFDAGTRVVDLVREPQHFHVAANTGLFRRDVLESFGLRFEGSVRPVWEDGHLTARYLSKFERPRVAMMADARYYYRLRADSSSLMDGQWSDPGKFVTVPRKGWLDALTIGASEHDGHAPVWLQNMIVYDVRGYFKTERIDPSPTAATPPEVSDEFFSILHECFAHIDLDVLDRFRGLHISHEVREVLRMTFAGAGNRPAEIAADRLDASRGLVRLRYYYAGDAPVEQFRARGLLVAPVHAKTRPCWFYGRALAYERIVWLPANGTLSVDLDGRSIPLRTGPAELRRLDLRPARVREALAGPAPDALPALARPGLRPRLGRAKRDVARRVATLRGDAERGGLSALATLRLSRTGHYRRKYLDGWLLSGHDGAIGDTAGDAAGDNAEHLYRWLRSNRPSVNAYLVLSRTGPDWARLSAEGCRLIELGSREHHLALLNARNVVSAQLEDPVTSTLPAELTGEGTAGGRHRTYLPDDVSTDDISIRVNREPIDLMITATTAGYRSIVADTSPYVLGDREVQLTGFPRHDRLLERARSAEGRDPRLVLVMPSPRPEQRDAWQALAGSDELRRVADAHGCRVELVPARAADVQRLLVHAVVLLTDYSPAAFDMAYLERAVVYCQFDGPEFVGGRRRGSWSCERDGFGPVTVDAATAIASIGELLERGGAVDPLYAQRMAQAFPHRDGECARRTHDAIAAMDVPLTEAELYRTLEPRDVLAGRPVADELRG